MKRAVLLGDSILDNGAYVEPGQEDVTAQLYRKLKPLGWSVECRAVDGDRVDDVARQLSASSVDMPCRFVLSVGGNDALGNIDLLDFTNKVFSSGEVLLRLHDVREQFRERYREALDGILSLGQPLIVCTIYNPSFPEPLVQSAAEAGLSIFNDVILTESLERGLPTIDLRVVCNEPGDFANPIEPSERGGDKITDAIVAKLTS